MDSQDREEYIYQVGKAYSSMSNLSQEEDDSFIKNNTWSKVTREQFDVRMIRLEEN